MCSQNESEVNIKNVSQFIEYLESNSYLNEKYLFRGHSNTAYEINPSINRNDNFKKERAYIEIPQLKFPEKFKPSQLPINQLALLQHYGFPTRLLDVTTNPLVALYFAVCSSNSDEFDGEIIVFNYSPNHLPIDVINALAQSYKFDFWGESYSINHFFEDFEIKKKLTKNMHSSNYESISYSLTSPFFIDVTCSLF